MVNSNTKEGAMITREKTIKEPAAMPAADSPAQTTPMAASPRAKKTEPATVRRKSESAAKPDNKPNKMKMVRDSFTMPETDYSQLEQLKKRCLRGGVHVKKSELLRAGLLALASLSDTALFKTVAAVEKLKTGRPAKA
jgi:hypothetical protein